MNPAGLTSARAGGEESQGIRTAIVAVTRTLFRQVRLASLMSLRPLYLPAKQEADHSEILASLRTGHLGQRAHVPFRKSLPLAGKLKPRNSLNTHSLTLLVRV